MLARFQHLRRGKMGNSTVRRVANAMRNAVRLTDRIGWHVQGKTLGIVFTELGDCDRSGVPDFLKERMMHAIRSSISSTETLGITFTFHFFPEDTQSNGHSTWLDLYPEFTRETWSAKLARGIKRMLDFFGSAALLLLCLGLFLVIALLIKLTSKGPVLFRQTRIGQHGKAFTFLKFRSMYVNNDATIHRDYVARFIAGRKELSSDGQSGIYKITNDPRITPLGLFLRKTSLDELPQLLNVLSGEMSLVGPRPPVLYEFQQYDVWHRRRVLEIKPGITGLWQVSGRSRTSFDEMVRLDLQYAREWSLWLDLKILLRTPKAVVFGNGAY